MIREKERGQTYCTRCQLCIELFSGMHKCPYTTPKVGSSRSIRIRIFWHRGRYLPYIGKEIKWWTLPKKYRYPKPLPNELLLVKSPHSTCSCLRVNTETLSLTVKEHQGQGQLLRYRSRVSVSSKVLRVEMRI